MDPRPSWPGSGSDSCHTRSARRSSARAGDTRSLRRARWSESLRDRELWQSRARLRATAHGAAASFGRVAPVWHVPGAFAGLDFEVIKAPRIPTPKTGVVLTICAGYCEGDAQQLSWCAALESNQQPTD